MDDNEDISLFATVPEMDDLAFRNLRTIVELVAKERNETE